MKRKTGYHTWLFEEAYWHRTLQGAARRLGEGTSAWPLGGRHAKVFEVKTGKNVTEKAWKAYRKIKGWK